jgi:hypothetical protein
MSKSTEFAISIIPAMLFFMGITLCAGFSYIGNAIKDGKKIKGGGK